MSFRRNRAERALRHFLRETLRNVKNLREFSAREILRAVREVEEEGRGMRRMRIRFLLIFILFFIFVPNLEDEDQSGDESGDHSGDHSGDES